MDRSHKVVTITTICFLVKNGGAHSVQYLVLYFSYLAVLTGLGWLALARFERNWMMRLGLSMPFSLLVSQFWALVLGAFLGVPLTWCFLVSALTLLGLCLFRRPPLGSAALKCLLFVPLFLAIGGVFLYPFTKHYAFNELGDYFSHWGYFTRRFVIDDHVTQPGKMWDLAFYNYPILGPISAYWPVKLLGTDGVVRYRAFWMFPIGVTLALAGLKRGRPSLFLAVISALLFVRYSPVGNPILGMWFTGYMDLFFGLSFFVGVFFLIRLSERYSARDFWWAILFGIMASQLRYDGNFAFAGIWLSAVMLSWKQIRFPQIGVAALVGLFPALWIVYEKIVLGGPGGFQSFDWQKGGPLLLPFTLKMIEQVRWQLPLWAVPLVLGFFGGGMPRVRQVLLLQLPTFMMFGPILMIYAGVHQEVLEAERMLGRSYLAELLVAAYIVIEFIQWCWRRISIPRRRYAIGAMVILGLISIFSDVRQLPSFVKQLHTRDNVYLQSSCAKEAAEILRRGDGNVIGLWDPSWPQYFGNKFDLIRDAFYPLPAVPVNVIGNSEELAASIAEFIPKWPRPESLHPVWLDFERKEVRWREAVISCSDALPQ